MSDSRRRVTVRLALAAGLLFSLLAAAEPKTVFDLLAADDPLTEAGAGKLIRYDLDLDGDGSLDLVVGNLSAAGRGALSATALVRRAGEVCRLGRISLMAGQIYVDHATGRLRVGMRKEAKRDTSSAVVEYDMRGIEPLRLTLNANVRGGADDPAAIPFSQLEQGVRLAEASARRSTHLVELDDVVFFESRRSAAPLRWRSLGTNTLAQPPAGAIDLFETAMPSCSRRAGE